MSKRPKLAYHQRTTASNNKTSSTSIVDYEFTGSDQHVPNNVTHVRIHPVVNKIKKYTFHNKQHLKEVVLNEGLTVIGEYAFSRCTSLQRINIPSTVTKIGTDAFYKCIKLREVVSDEGLRIIHDRAFVGCKSLKSIQLPSTVIKIGQLVFLGCSSLREVVLSDGLKKILSSAFDGCSSLQSISIPSTVTEISSSAFKGCTNLRSVVLNDGIKKIKEGAFKDCASLERIDIPSTVIEIEYGAFKDCTSLREVTIQNEEIQIGATSFNNCLSLERFKFPGLSARLDNVIRAGQRNIEAKMDGIPAVEWRGGELIIPSVRREIENRLFGGMDTLVGLNKEKLEMVKGLIRYYELKEATTLFELALWKSKINQAQAEGDSAGRGARRVEVPGPVKDTILQYLR